MDWRPLFEAMDLSSSLPGRMAVLKRKLDWLVVLYLAALGAMELASQRMGMPKMYQGWKAVIAVVLVTGPLIALIVFHIRARHQMEKQISREAGVSCQCCGSTPRAHQMAEWIAQNRCVDCGGALQKDFSNLTYKDSWPSWKGHTCDAD
jgi:hypothetical protein